MGGLAAHACRAFVVRCSPSDHEHPIVCHLAAPPPSFASFKLRHNFGSVRFPRRKRLLGVVVVAKQVQVPPADVDEVIWDLRRWGLHNTMTSPAERTSAEAESSRLLTAPMGHWLTDCSIPHRFATPLDGGRSNPSAVSSGFTVARERVSTDRTPDLRGHRHPPLPTVLSVANHVVHPGPRVEL